MGTVTRTVQPSGHHIRPRAAAHGADRGTARPGHAAGDDRILTEHALRARAGDPEAAAYLVRQTYPQVHRLLGMLADRGVAEDLTQETFARVFRALPGFRAESPVRAWLLSIARRVAADHLRAARVRPRIDWTAEPQESTEPHLQADLGESVALRAVIEGLAPDRRLAFVLTQLQGLSYQEAAQVCGCPIGTIRSRVARAREDLVAQITEPVGMSGEPGPLTAREPAA